MSDSEQEIPLEDKILMAKMKRVLVFAIPVLLAPLIIFNGEIRRMLGDCSIDNLPAGDCIGTYDSPDKTYTIKTFRCDGDATVDFAVRGTVIYNRQWWYRYPRNLYWEYHCSDAKVTWVDSETVNINGKQLNVERGSYDFRFH